MEIIIDILLVFCCLILAYEDFRHREISLWLIIATGFFMAVSVLTKQENPSIIQIVFNLGFIGGLFLVFLIRARSKKTKVFSMVAEGDWIMLLLFAFSFTYFHFTLFLAITYISALFVSLFVKLMKKQSYLVPLAGFLCVSFVLQIGMKYFLSEYTLL